MTGEPDRDPSKISRRRFVAGTIVTGAAAAVPAPAEAAGGADASPTVIAMLGTLARSPPGPTSLWSAPASPVSPRRAEWRRRESQ